MRGPRSSRQVQQVEVPGTQLWGPVGVGISAAQEGKAREVAHVCLSAGLIGAGGGGTGSILVHSQAFPGVKTSRPRRDSSERDLASPISGVVEGEGVSRQAMRFAC